VFLDEPQTLREAAAKHLAAATENYERHGRANSPAARITSGPKRSLQRRWKNFANSIEQLG